MLKIRVIAMGRLTEAAFREAAGEYAKRISRFYALTVEELKPEPTPASPSRADIDKALDREADRILAAVPPRALLWAMCVEGRSLSSEAFSEKIAQAADSGSGDTGSGHLRPGCQQRYRFNGQTSCGIFSRSGNFFPVRLLCRHPLRQQRRPCQNPAAGADHPRLSHRQPGRDIRQQNTHRSKIIPAQ